MLGARCSRMQTGPDYSTFKKSYFTICVSIMKFRTKVTKSIFKRELFNRRYINLKVIAIQILCMLEELGLVKITGTLLFSYLQTFQIVTKTSR